MSTSYSTITSKGQITLPAAARRALDLRAGQKVGIRVEGDHLVIEPPRSIVDIRARLRAEAELRGTWHIQPAGGDGWAAQAEERSAES